MHAGSLVKSHSRWVKLWFDSRLIETLTETPLGMQLHLTLTQTQHVDVMQENARCEIGALVLFKLKLWGGWPGQILGFNESFQPDSSSDNYEVTQDEYDEKKDNEPTCACDVIKRAAIRGTKTLLGGKLLEITFM